MRSIIASILVLGPVCGLAACGDSGTSDGTADATATTDTTVADDATVVADTTTAEDTATTTAPGDGTTTEPGDTATTEPGDTTTTSDDATLEPVDTVDSDVVVQQCTQNADCQALGIVPHNNCLVPVCLDGQCGLGPPDCDDADPCTVDSCVPATGACAHDTVQIVSGASRYTLCPGPASQSVAANWCLGLGQDLASFDTLADADAVTAQIAGAGQGDPWVRSIGGVTCSSGGKGKVIQPQCRVWQAQLDMSCATIVGCDELHPFVCEATCEDGDPCTVDVMDADGKCSASALDCDDANVCTNDHCEPFFGCVNEVPAGTCADSDPCTTDECAPADGACSHKGVRQAWSATTQYVALECPGTASWADARQRCLVEGGVMAMPVTDVQQAVMAGVATRPGATTDLWVPAHEVGGPPTGWTWVDNGGSGEPPWCVAEPDLGAGADLCAAWSGAGVCTGDFACTELKSFACVIDTWIP